MTESVREETCPDCGRIKAATVDSILRGDCPKWYAINDPDADIDCRMEKQRIEILRAFPPIKDEDPLSQPSGLRAVRECEHYAKGYADELCEACKGTGQISREIPVSEAAEIPGKVLSGDVLYYPEERSHRTNELWHNAYFLLPSGERVEGG